jgi:hypothetical protein
MFSVGVRRPLALALALALATGPGPSTLLYIYPRVYPCINPEIFLNSTKHIMSSTDCTPSSTECTPSSSECTPSSAECTTSSTECTINSGYTLQIPIFTQSSCEVERPGGNHPAPVQWDIATEMATRKAKIGEDEANYFPRYNLPWNHDVSYCCCCHHRRWHGHRRLRLTFIKTTGVCRD